MSSKCSAALKHLVDYLEGELDEDEQRELESHFSDCPPCMRFLKSYRDTGKVCKKALQRSMPPKMKGALLDFLRAKTGES
ncbi:MAG: anti-sigma factor family protein [Persicimonas sp.]